ncbi:MAG: ribonuclease J [Acidobacteriota bacterium]
MSAATDPPLEIVPLGGLGEFGLNTMAIGLGDTLLVVDVGVMFPGSELLGVDLVIPDMTYLFENRDRLKAVVLTHGHEDHIGALPYLLSELQVPVYGTRLTLGMCRNRLEEHKLASRTEFRTVAPGETRAFGPLRVDFIRVSHSMADCLGLAIETPHGTIIHTGDFKFDQSPVVGDPVDIHRLARYGEKGVLALFSDSTNSERPGHTGSERSVADTFDELIGRASGRVVVVCFTSSTHRIQLTLDAAARHARKVALLGRSMSENIQTAIDLGYLRVPSGLLIRATDIPATRRDQLLILAAGSQGEPLSAMSQIAIGSHKHASVESGDMVIFSSRVIPGNERATSRVINHLYRRGAEVVHSDVATVHVSGHASAEELKLILHLIQPRYFTPIHGEWRQLVTHARIAEGTGIPPNRILLAEDGDVIAFDGDGGRLAGKQPAGRVFVDGSGMGDVGDIVLRDRQHLSSGGIVIPVVAINSRTGRMETAPDIITRGFLTGEEGDELLAAARELVVATVESSPIEEVTDWGLIKEKIQTELRRFFRKRTNRRPMILPVIMEI